MTETSIPAYRPRPAGMRIVDTLTMALLCTIAAVGLRPTFGDWWYMLPAGGGILLGTMIALVCAWRRWGLLVVAGFTVAGYFVFGGALALPHTTLYGIPTLTTLQQLAVGAVTSWKRFLTAAAPLLLEDGHGIVPLLLMLLVSVTAVSFALRLRAAAWALLPIVAGLLLQGAMGIPQPAFPLAQGIALAVVGVSWLGIRHAYDPSKHLVTVHTDTMRSGKIRPGRRRFFSGAAVLALAVGVAVGTSGVTLPQQPRSVLRDVVVPPLQLHEYTSPLQSFRAYVRDYGEKTQFTVESFPKGERLRLAVLDQYNGVVMNVADDNTSGSSRFAPLREGMSPEARGAIANVTVQVGDYSGAWLPTLGTIRSLSFEGAQADAQRRATYVNEDTSTVIDTNGLVKGQRYKLETVLPAVPSAEKLDAAEFANVPRPDQVNVPQNLRDRATIIVKDAKTPIERVRALQDWLRDNGYFSHGLAGQPRSLPGHGAARLSDFLGAETITGDDEQYAVAMALMADSLGIPARVVMGWYDPDAPAGSLDATGDNLHVWVEVAFKDIGWYAVDATPDENKLPTESAPKPKADPKPQVLQPPPPPQEPAEIPPAVADERKTDDAKKPPLLEIPLVVLIAGGSVLALLLLLSPFVTIAAVKASRRKKRIRAERTPDRIAGAWNQVVDSAVDLRIPVLSSGTRAEVATALEDQVEGLPVRALAQRADVQVFGPGTPSADQANKFWDDADTVIQQMSATRSCWARMRAKISVRSLLGRRAQRARGRRANLGKKDGGDRA